MKKVIVMLALVGIIQGGMAKGPGSGEGIQFFHGSWAEALKKAQSENKNIFVDFYADWCGPCRMMTREVFVDKAVGDYFNANIISFKINAEKEELELVRQVNIEAYPTLVVFDPSGAVLMKQVGALEAEGLLSFVKSVKGFDQVSEDYQKDPMNFKKFETYIEMLRYREQDKVSAEVTRFLDQLPLDSLKTEAAWTIIVNRLDDYNSKTFKTLCENAKWFRENKSDFESAFGWFMNAMVVKSTENDDSELVEKLKSDYLLVRKSAGTLTKEEGYYRKGIDIAIKRQKADTTFSADMLDMAVKYHGKDWKVVSATILDVLSNGTATQSDLKRCLVLAKKMVTLNNNSFTNYVVAVAYEANADVAGNKDKARASLIQAIAKANIDELSLNAGAYATIAYKETQASVGILATKFE